LDDLKSMNCMSENQERERQNFYTSLRGKEEIKCQKGKKEAVFVENITLHLMPLLNADTNGCKRHTTLKSPFSFFFLNHCLIALMLIFML